LTVNQRGRVNYSRLLHLEIEVVSFARPLTHAAEHRLSAVSLGYVVDQLHDDDGLADAGAAEESDLSTLHERRDQIDDLDARLEHLGLGLEVGELGRGSVDRPPLDISRNRRTVVDWVPEHVENSTQRGLSDRNRDRTASVLDVHAANNGIGRRHRPCTTLVTAEVLLHSNGHTIVAPGTDLLADPKTVVKPGRI